MKRVRLATQAEMGVNRPAILRKDFILDRYRASSTRNACHRLFYAQIPILLPQLILLNRSMRRDRNMSDAKTSVFRGWTNSIIIDFNSPFLYCQVKISHVYNTFRNASSKP